MKAFALDELGQPGSLHDLPVPEPGEGQVRGAGANGKEGKAGFRPGPPFASAELCHTAGPVVRLTVAVWVPVRSTHVTRT